jgi:ubiquinone biosynthesis protein COQ4
MTMAMRSLQLSPLRALRAARALAANPDDLPQVFTIIEALSLDTMARIHARMARDCDGQKILDERPDIVELLADRAALARLPAGSLGRAYLEFMEREQISAEGIRAANAEGARADAALPPPLDYVFARMRDTHDLWHAATGWHGDILGEAALLAFAFAQVRNPAIALIIAIGLYKTARWPGATRLIVDGFRRGWRAAWLPAQRWETLLPLPLDEVRARLRLDAPAEYAPVRTSMLELHSAA